MSHRGKSGSVLGKFGWSQVKKNQDQQLDETGCLKTWVHPANRITESYVTYTAKYLGSVEVSKAKGVEIIKEAVKKLKISYEVKKSEAGNKGSKLQKVEISLNLDSVKVVDVKTKAMLFTRPLHRVSYCADDHVDRKLFTFIAKDQETRKHCCFAFICDKEAAELTLSFGQAFQMAYRRYIEKEKKESKMNNELINLEKQIEKMKAENDLLKIRQNDKVIVDEQKDAFKINGNSSVEDKSFVSTDPHSTLPFTQTASEPLFSLQSVINPYPTSPDPRSPSYNMNDENLFDAGFDTMETTKENSFNPFSNFDGGNTVMGETTQHLPQDNGGISLFPSNTFINNNNSYNLFDSYGMSPKQEDFCTKEDPFADVPDWQNVASEKTNNNPQQINSNSFTVTNDRSHLSSFNPFETNISNDKSANLAEPQNLSGFGNYNSENDLFSRYLSNVVANRDSPSKAENEVQSLREHQHQRTQDNSLTTHYSSETSNHSTEFNFNGSSQMSFDINDDLDVFDNPSQTNYLPDAPNGFTNDPFSEEKQVNSDNCFQTDFSQLSVNENTMSAVAPLNVSRRNTLSCSQLDQEFESQTDQKQTFRPRPSAQNRLSQGLPAPPSKQDIKAFKPTVTAAIPRPRKISQTGSSVAQSTPQIQNMSEKIVSSSHTLPNVARGQSFEQPLGVKSRSRTTSGYSIPPLGKSISMASKSLDDMTDSSRQPFNRFNITADL